MPVIRAPSVIHTLRSSNPYMGFLTGFDDRLLLSRASSSSSTEGLYPDSDYRQYNGPSQWIGTNALLSELDMYEPASHCPPPFITTTNDESYSRYDDPFDSNSFSFSYDSASSSSGSPFALHDATASLVAMSPSLSLTSSSPRSEPGALSPHIHDFGGGPFFDFERCNSSSLAPEYQTGDWSTTSSISPSPSFSNLDSLDVKPIISRGPSPIRQEGEKADRRRFPCHVIGCERKFTSQYTLKVHMEAHKPKPRVTFPCTEGCSERFSRQHDRLRHEVAKHGKVCEFLCDDCGRFFSTKKTLGNHKCPVAQGSTRWVTS